MADYTNISNASIEPYAPLVSPTLFALRDNPIAIAQGAPGAPRIQGAALDPDAISQGVFKESSIGESVVCRLCLGSSQTQATSFGNKNISSSNTFWATILVGGRVRVKYTQAATGGSGSIARLFVNNTASRSDTIDSGESFDRVVDINVNRGDQITLQHVITGTFTGSSVISNAIICASSDSPIVAA